MKRVFALILTAALLLGALTLPAAAASVAVSDADAAEALAALGLLEGTGSSFELDRSATRAEALTLLLRLLGREQAALAETDACPFSDGGWAAQRITYAWKNGLVKGQSADCFGSDEAVGARDWLTMLLRALGYSEDSGDFTWEQSIAFADSIGLCHGEYTAAGDFLRGDMVRLAYNALSLERADGEGTLALRLYRDGVVSGSALKIARLAAVLDAAGDKPVYSGVEIHDLFAPAVFLVEAYESLENFEKDKPDTQGSGFFITANGVAVMCCHEIEGVEAMRVTTLDGRRYEVTGVLFYDAFWDAAVVRVSRTDDKGRQISAFPYLELGDSDLTAAGETVYQLGNSLGYPDSITSGMISNRSRNVDDPDYLYFQYTAPATSGCSGGPLLNCHGEVIGIHFGSFVGGQNMNLAVPINVIAGVNLSSGGTTLQRVKETENAKKAEAVLSAEQTEFKLKYGEEVTVMISHTGSARATIRYEIDSWDVVDCTWGNFVKKRSVPLTIKAIGDGEAEITISFADENGNENSDVVLYVTVTGTPDETAEPLPSGETSY